MLLTESAEVAEGLDLAVFRRQGCTVPRRQVALAPGVCGSSVWDLLHVTLLVPDILRWLREFRKMCALQS
jgi:hypothetical protein